LPSDDADNLDRLEQLESFALPPNILALALGRPPHPLFERICQPLKIQERSEVLGCDLTGIQEPGISGDGKSIALWEEDHEDGHCFDIFYAVNDDEGIEYWHVRYADDMDGPDAKRVAKSEQGLFFWLFFYLIGHAYFVAKMHETALQDLRAAAGDVGVRHLENVMTLEEEIGTDYSDQEAVLCKRSLAIRD
jgi:hypothetical protein